MPSGAFASFLAAARMGDADAAFNLGRMHEWKQVQRRGDASALELQREIASEAAPGGRSGPGYSASEAAALARSWKEDAAYWHGVGCERGLAEAAKGRRMLETPPDALGLGMPRRLE